MPDPVSSLASIQLGFLQSPEIARETAPIASQAQLANAQSAVITAEYSQQFQETIQRLPALESAVVRDALEGKPDSQGSRSYRERRRRIRQPVQDRAVPIAAAHPRGLGAWVDVRA